VVETTTTKTTKAPKALLTLPQAASRLDCSVGALRKWLRQGRLRAVRLGRAVRLRAEDVERAISEGIPPAPTSR
jgi:excisionase family DNA binding protein